MASPNEFTKYETARIIGARALQIAMNAPLLIKIKQEDLEKIKYDAIKIAEIEFNSGILPISVKKPYPKRKKEKLKRPKEVKLSEKKKENLESEEEKDIVEEGEIMALANPEDEEEQEIEEEGEEE
jgi:DNA-directed RNA polymerase subunit K